MIPTDSGNVPSCEPECHFGLGGADNIGAKKGAKFEKHSVLRIKGQRTPSSRGGLRCVAGKRENETRRGYRDCLRITGVPLRCEASLYLGN